MCQWVDFLSELSIFKFQWQAAHSIEPNLEPGRRLRNYLMATNYVVFVATNMLYDFQNHSKNDRVDHAIAVLSLTSIRSFFPLCTFSHHLVVLHLQLASAGSVVFSLGN